MPRPRYWLHALLFLATCATTTYFGDGPVFSATLMTILVTHELGHYIVARRRGIAVSLPYFIPLPVGIGTMGAVIRMRAPIQDRDALVDMAAAGPLAGLAVAIPLLVIGLIHSPVVPPDAHSLQEGNSLLYILLKLVTKGRYLPGGGLDVQLGPMAMAAWVGMLVTFINLIPIGQLDGGHVAYAFFGAHYERFSRWLHLGLLAVGAGVTVVLGTVAYTAGHGAKWALIYRAESAFPWLLWSILLLVMRGLSGGLYHPPVGPAPLAPSRRALCLLVGAIFLLLFTPVPMREGL